MSAGRGYKNTAAIRAGRREAAEKRNGAWSELGPSKQVECLDNRLGRGVGAKRQRARLAKKLAKAS